ncbi:hypothetical protein WCU37_08845 [Serratia marcescens]|uniref:hypothetical protein n=1 Tax=Serratia TaxID=613 RepID=UPI0030CEB559
MEFSKDGRTISPLRLFIIALNIAGVLFAFASGVVEHMLGYYIWNWDAERWYALLMFVVPVINIWYLWIITGENGLLGLWLKRKRLEEQRRIHELEKRE